MPVKAFHQTYSFYEAPQASSPLVSCNRKRTNYAQQKSNGFFLQHNQTLKPTKLDVSQASLQHSLQVRKSELRRDPVRGSYNFLEAYRKEIKGVIFNPQARQQGRKIVIRNYRQGIQDSGLSPLQREAKTPIREVNQHFVSQYKKYNKKK